MNTTTETRSTTALVSSTVAQKEVEDWIANYVGELRTISPASISRLVSLRKYGLDSATAVTLSGDLMDWLHCDVDPSLFYTHPTIEKAAAHLLTLEIQA